jgi:hypothetical protein
VLVNLPAPQIDEFIVAGIFKNQRLATIAYDHPFAGTRRCFFHDLPSQLDFKVIRAAPRAFDPAQNLQKSHEVVGRIARPRPSS